MIVEVLSIFPEVFTSYLQTSILGRAQAAGIFTFAAYDLRNWTDDRHRSVDDAPFGGGCGMLMKPKPIFEAVRWIKAQRPIAARTIFFTPCGAPFSQACAKRLSREPRILFVCGRYEGMDERVYDLADECLSIGDYVLTGGELPAMVVTDALVRLLPGALGGDMSSSDESFSSGLLEYAQYTRPSNFEGKEVPSVLLSGNHAAIDAWRRRDAIRRTARWRPDLLEVAQLTDEEYAYAQTCINVEPGEDRS